MGCPGHFLLLVVTLRYISIVLVVRSSWRREVVIVGGKGKSNSDYVTMPRGPNGPHYCIVHRRAISGTAVFQAEFEN